jgi:putative DNA methylase
MQDRAFERIGHFYPKAKITAALVKERPDLKAYEGQTLTVIAWLWARTIRSPNPAFGHVEVPLLSSFLLGTKEGREVYLEPSVRGEQYRFEIRFGKPPEAAKNGTKAAGKGSNFFCLVSGSPIEGKYIKAEAQAGRLGSRMIAVVAEGKRGRVYLTPTSEHEAAATVPSSPWSPSQDLVGKARDQMPLYGMPTFGDLFTARQLTALNTFSDLLAEVKKDAAARAAAAGYSDSPTPLEHGGDGARAYAEAISIYLAFAIDRSADYWSAVSSWHSGPKMEAIRNTFGRQAISMTWDYAEANPFSESSGNWMNNADWCIKAIEGLPGTSCKQGTAQAEDAAKQVLSTNKVVSTDPPYYDNIAYADLSDFFYVWLRRNLRDVFPGLFATMAVPKADELVATLYRHNSREAAETFFLDGMTRAMHNLATLSHPAYPVSIYYAFKQSETKGDSGTSSTGWDTFLQAVLNAGFSLTGTWPMRTEMGNRMVGSGTNALASSIVLVCRPRPSDASTVSRREFIRELNATLPQALDEMTRGGVNSPVAPVDLSQAIIGPGMAIFSQYAGVLEADGTPMQVKTALQLINRFLAEDDFDHDTQFCLHWFEQQGWATGKFGEADVLARAKGTSVDGLKATGVVASGKGDLRLLRWAELPRDWSPETDVRLPVWEALHHLIRALNQDGESSAGALLARMPARAEPIRALAYRLYTLCERKGWADDARAYNELVTAWGAVEQAAGEAGVIGTQARLDI